MTTDFVNRCSEFLKAALQSSPSLTRSHVQEYLRQRESSHKNLAKQTQSLFDKVGLTAADFAFNPRNKYAGEISFLLKMFPKALNDQIKRYRDLQADLLTKGSSDRNHAVAEINEQIYQCDI